MRNIKKTLMRIDKWYHTRVRNNYTPQIEKRLQNKLTKTAHGVRLAKKCPQVKAIFTVENQQIIAIDGITQFYRTCKRSRQENMNYPQQIYAEYFEPIFRRHESLEEFIKDVNKNLKNGNSISDEGIDLLFKKNFETLEDYLLLAEQTYELLGLSLDAYCSISRNGASLESREEIKTKVSSAKPFMREIMTAVFSDIYAI